MGSVAAADPALAAGANAVPDAPSAPAPPFLDAQTPPLSPLGAVGLALLLPWLALRLFLSLFAIALYTALVLCVRTPNDDPDAPQFSAAAYPTVLRLSFLVTRVSLRLCGFRLRVTGAEHIRRAYEERTATVVVCNHVAIFDVLAVAATVGPYHPVARADVAHWPLCAFFRVRAKETRTRWPLTRAPTTPQSAACCVCGASRRWTVPRAGPE